MFAFCHKYFLSILRFPCCVVGFCLFEDLSSQIIILFSSLFRFQSMAYRHTKFTNNSYSDAIFQSMTSTIFLVCIFDVQNDESSSYIFDDTDTSANMKTNSVSQPTYDDLSNKPFSIGENRYRILFICMVFMSI